MSHRISQLYICDSCGNEATTWSGKCSFCGEWNSLKEVPSSFINSVSHTKNVSKIEPKKLSEIEVKNNFRIETNLSEFNRVLGGGIIPGSIILLGGEPGIGKSTLLLQITDSISDTIYVSAEESLSQIKIRAERIGIKSNLELIANGDLESIEKTILKEKPNLVIIDSIQTVYLNSFPSTPGSIVQVKECGIFLQRLAKSSGIPIIIVGHVTKDGSIAGPRILEHLVDVVLYLEGERYHDARVLRGIKNRFGSTNEIGIFEIVEKGMREIKNPSELFLGEKRDGPGSIVTSTLEGTRPLLVEVQALVAPTHFGYPKRTASGFDLNRLNLLAAVISKKTAVNLSNYDIYVNVIGGIKIHEPATDLAICAALMSSYKNKSFSGNLCLFGEVGLSGEVRKVTRQEAREKEAKSLGYDILKSPISGINGLLKLLK